SDGARSGTAQANPRAPAERVALRAAQKLAWSAVGLRGVANDLAAEADDLADQARELGNRKVLAGAEIDQGRRIRAHQLAVTLLWKREQEDAGIGQVVAVDELAPRTAGAPDRQLGFAPALRLVRLADERGQHVGIAPVVLVSRAEQVGWHCRAEL